MSEAIKIEDFNYELPEQRIAQEAVEPRDSSKLLYLNGDHITDHVFSDITELLPEGSTLFFNDAKVIPARLHVRNRNGAHIEIFLLQPFMTDYYTAINARNQAEWICLVGNKKKWKEDEVLFAQVGDISIGMRQLQSGAVRFNWQGDMPFIELLEQFGAMPLPPYIRHEAGEHDKERYQTVYSRNPGSVAAPTAGLHFTEAVLESIRKKGIVMAHGTLHVSAGTFLPVKTENAEDHVMHKEIFSVTSESLEILRDATFVSAVGTTSCRILESLYWCGVNLVNNRDMPFHITQFAYKDNYHSIPSPGQAVEALITYCREHHIQSIQGETSIMITPAYRFQFVRALITNFHQPKSTLLLLISAFIGERWKKVYQHALAHGYRFLSYGDSSFLVP